MVGRSGSVSVSLTEGSGSGRPKNMDTTDPDSDQDPQHCLKLILNYNLMHFSISIRDSLWCSGSEQWGRRLEGWPNTVARLDGGWRRWYRQVCTWWTVRTACLSRTVPITLTKAAQLRADGISICCYIVNVHNHPSWATSHKEGTAWYSSRPMPSLW